MLLGYVGISYSGVLVNWHRGELRKKGGMSTNEATEAESYEINIISY